LNIAGFFLLQEKENIGFSYFRKKEDIYAFEQRMSTYRVQAHG